MNSTPLQKERIAIIDELVAEFINTGRLPQRLTFRASHRDALDILDDLEHSQVIQTNDSRYELPLSCFMQSKFWPKEEKLANRVLKRMEELYEDPEARRTVEEMRPRSDVPMKDNDLERAIFYLYKAGFTRGHSANSSTKAIEAVYLDESVIRYKTITEKVQKDQEHRDQYVAQGYNKPLFSKTPAVAEVENGRGESDRDDWKDIEAQYEIRKWQFGKMIRFIAEGHGRDIIFRDVAHAHRCLKLGLYKPAVILSGSVIEEMLRRYIETKGYRPKSNHFYGYIVLCREKELLGAVIANLTNVIKDFRNIVHLNEEKSSKDAITKAKAANAVNAIFIVAREFS